MNEKHLSPVEKDVLGVLEAFVARHGAGTFGELHAALIELAARSILGAAAIRLMDAPDADACPFCLTAQEASRRAHEATGGETAH